MIQKANDPSTSVEYIRGFQGELTVAESSECNAVDASAGGKVCVGPRLLYGLLAVNSSSMSTRLRFRASVLLGEAALASLTDKGVVGRPVVYDDRSSRSDGKL